MALFLNTELSEYATRIKNQKGQEDKTFKLVLDNKLIKELIIFLNTDDQLGDDRINSLGEQLGFYSFVTEQLSGGKKKAGEPFNLRDTGDFWESWRVFIGSGNIIIDADPNKEDTNLFDEYGIDVLGLTDMNLQVLIDEALEQYIFWYQRNILPQ
jgi:hypothetical protein